MTLIPLVAFGPVLVRQWSRIRGSNDPLASPDLKLWHRILCVLLAYVFLIGPEAFHHYAQGAIQYGDLSTLAWGRGNTIIEYGYDANGSLTSKTTSDTSGSDTLETVVYAYNLQNRLSKVTTTPYIEGSPGTPEVVEYVYNPSGIRVQKVVDDAHQTDYLIDPYNHTGYAQVLEEWTSDITTPANPVLESAVYYTIGDDVIAQTRAEDIDGTWTVHDTEYLLSDGHGSTRQLANPDGAVHDSYSYDAYGVMLGDNATPNPAQAAATSLLYAGEQFDTHAGQYYLRARYYDPLNGLFNRTDPYHGNTQDPQSLHKYLYCHNNPVNATDPTGLSYTMTETLSVMNIMVGLMLIGSVPLLYKSTKMIVKILLMDIIIPMAQTLIATGHDALIHAGVILLSKLKDFTEAAKEVLKDIASKINKTIEQLSKMKIFPVPQIIMPFIFTHTVSCLSQRPDWFILTYNGRRSSTTQDNRLEVLRDLPSLLTGWSWDEFPYASTAQGGTGAMVAKVPLLENCIQGGMLGAFYRWVLKGVPYSEFLVVPIPMYVKGKS